MSQRNAQERQRRRKIPLACEPCRERKIRCDGSKPVCSACQRRGFSLEHCLYTIENARTANRDSYIQTLHDRIRFLERTIQQSGAAVPPVASEDHAVSGTGVTRELPDPIIGTGADSYRGTAHNVSEVSPDRRAAGIVSPQCLDDVEAENGVTAMGTLDHEGVISAEFKDSEQFYGSSSAASFMRQAVETTNSPVYTANRRNTPTEDSPARESQKQKQMKGDQDYMCHAYSENFNLPPRSLADHLLGRFWEKVYYLYPVFDRSAFERAYRALWEPQTEQSSAGSFPNIGLGGSPDGGGHPMLFHCALNTMFAIGVSFSDIPSAAKDVATATFFQKAKSFIGLDLLDINNIGLVQVFLLITIFLQSTRYPSRCWNAIGMACRVAQGLGLHIGTPRRERSPLEIEISRRTWQGCVILDMTVSLTFGRPAMTLHLPEHPTSNLDAAETKIEIQDRPPREDPSRLVFFAEYYRLCRLLREILGQVYQGGHFGQLAEATPVANHSENFTAIFQLDHKLLQYEESLPPMLSWRRPMDLEKVSESRQSTIQTQRRVLHGRFLYLRIMLYRPMFTQLCSSREKDPMLTPLYKSFMLLCAKNCVQSSLDLVELVYRTHRKIASEWWWDGLYACTSGLVLSFSQLHSELRNCFDHSIIQQYWEHCEVVLDHLSTNSPSVQKTLKILRKIRDPIIAEGITEAGELSAVETADNVTLQLDPGPMDSGIGELVEMLPFQLMDDAGMPDMSDMAFDWNQRFDAFNNI
ncbi:fungal-specific transcription factor domain-containing protein [Nemania abortiva]|nr:fungal-specific transcription factor domain-containing protein [Nemania abortiva]